jgi:hypothetical protein
MSRSYTKDQMLGQAREAGFSPSGRLFTDWVSVGLLDEGRRRGLGRGKGTTVTWPDEQLRLFLALLEKRPQIVPNSLARPNPIAGLCNIPVWLWLWWGETYVPTRQARRALVTWTGISKNISMRQARLTAAQFVARVAHPDAPKRDVNALRDLLATTAFRTPLEAPYPEAEITTALERVFDPQQSGRTLGPPAARFTVEGYALLVQARLRALSALKHHTVKDETLEIPRAMYLDGRIEYAEKVVPQIAADPEVADAFLARDPTTGLLLPPTGEEVANNACLDLLTTLGIYLTITDNNDKANTPG